MLTQIQKYWMGVFSREILPKKAKSINIKKRQLYLTIREKEAELRASGALDEGLKQEKYVHKENYNFEMYLKYTKLLRQQIQLDSEEKVPKIPKKLKKKYNKPKYDLSLTDYYVWPCFHNPYYKIHDHSSRVVCKLYVSPKSLVHTFGYGAQPSRNKGATREFDFEDSNLDKFLIYDYRQTTEHWGRNRGDEFYKKQEFVRPIHQKKKWPTPLDFWESEESVPFRVNCTNYADFRKFKVWVQNEIELNANKKSYEERILEKFGMPELYDSFDKQYEVLKEPPIFKYARTFFLEKGQKLDKEGQLNDALSPPERLGEEYRVSKDQYRKLLQEDQVKQLKSQGSV